MAASHGPEPEALSVLDRLGIAEDPLVGADPVSFLRSLVAAGAAPAKNPAATGAANVRLALGIAAALRASTDRAVGGHSPGPISATHGDHRFDDPAFTDNPFY